MSNKKRIVIVTTIVIAIVIIAVVLLILNQNQTETKNVVNNPNSTGSVEKLKENDNVNDKIKSLTQGMKKNEAHNILGIEPTEKGNVNTNEYDEYEKYDIGDDFIYEIYYNDGVVFGISAVVK